MAEPTRFEQIIGLVPCNPKLLFKLNSMAAEEGNPMFKPSIEHSITQCQRCGQDCWIGPNQKQMADSVLFATLAICYVCIMLDPSLRPLVDNMVSVNQDIENVPKRF